MQNRNQAFRTCMEYLSTPGPDVQLCRQPLHDFHGLYETAGATAMPLSLLHVRQAVSVSGC